MIKARYPLEDKDVYNIMGQVKHNQIKYYQFYDLDFPLAGYNYHKYLESELEEKDDPKKKILNKTYYDIEAFIDPPIFPDPMKAERPVNAIATYNTNDNTAIIYYLSVVKASITINPNSSGIYYVNEQDTEVVSKGVKEGYKKLCEDNPDYFIDELNIVVKEFKDEVELLTEFFNDRKKEKSLFLIGFNNDNFDDPYIVNRLVNLVGRERSKFIISEFGEVSFYKGYSTWPDINKVDFLVNYKPVDLGGGGYGKSLPNYKLNTIAEVELKLNKLDLPGGFNDNYLNDIINYLTYNLMDTLLVYLLDKKKQILELLWSLNIYNNSIMSQTIRGRSLIYTMRNNAHYVVNRKQAIRFKRINSEVVYPI